MYRFCICRPNYFVAVPSVLQIGVKQTVVVSVFKVNTAISVGIRFEDDKGQILYQAANQSVEGESELMFRLDRLEWQCRNGSRLDMQSSTLDFAASTPTHCLETPTLIVSLGAEYAAFVVLLNIFWATQQCYFINMKHTNGSNNIVIYLLID